VQGKVVIGTTERKVDDVEDVTATEGEVDFLLAEVSKYLSVAPTRNDVLSVWYERLTTSITATFITSTTGTFITSTTTTSCCSGMMFGSCGVQGWDEAAVPGPCPQRLRSLVQNFTQARGGAGPVEWDDFIGRWQVDHVS
jgi:hypothetical protein